MSTTPMPSEQPIKQEPLPWPTPMARRANWDKRYRMRLNIGRLGEKESVTITWEGNDAGVVRSTANTFVAAYNASLPKV